MPASGSLLVMKSGSGKSKLRAGDGPPVLGRLAVGMLGSSMTGGRPSANGICCCCPCPCHWACEKQSKCQIRKTRAPLLINTVHSWDVGSSEDSGRTCGSRDCCGPCPGCRDDAAKPLPCGKPAVNGWVMGALSALGERAVGPVLGEPWLYATPGGGDPELFCPEPVGPARGSVPEASGQGRLC